MSAYSVTFLRHFADEFGITHRQDGPNLGLEHLVDHVRDNPSCFTLFPADTPLPSDAHLRSIPLMNPTPLYAWSLAWRESTPHPSLDAVLQACTRAARTRRWLDHAPDHDWLPNTTS